MRVPDSLKLAVGDAIILASRIETCVIDLLHLLSGEGGEIRRKLASVSATQNLKLLQKKLARLSDSPQEELWVTARKIYERRNLMVHGAWAMADGILIITDYKQPGSDAEIPFAVLTDEQFAWFIRQAKQVFILLAKRQLAILEAQK